MRPMVVHLSSPVEFLPISTKCSVYAEMAVSEFKLHLWQTGLHWIQVDGWRRSRIILGQLRALRAEMHLWRSQRLERSHQVTHRFCQVCPLRCVCSLSVLDIKGWAPRTNWCSPSGLWSCWYIDLVTGQTLWLVEQKWVGKGGENISHHAGKFSPEELGTFP